LCSGIAACSGPRKPGPTNRTSLTEARLVAADSNSSEWLTNGGNFENSRFSPLHQLDTSTAGQLRPAWRHALGRASLTERFFGATDSARVWYRPRTWGVHPRQWGNDRQISTPLVADGMIYYTGAYNVVVAVNAASGREVWRYQHRMGRVPLLCCGPHNRGVAL